MIVSVPKILDVLREHVARTLSPAAGRPAAARRALPATLVALPHACTAPFGWKFWSFVVGAAPLDPALEEFWQRLGFVVIQGYGLTETAPIVSLNHPFGTSRGSVGKAIAGRRDEDRGGRRDPRPRRERHAAATTARPPQPREAFEDGWFHTGDIGELDGEGRLFIRGRKKEMIVTPEGLNVFPEDVERVVDAAAGRA